MATVVKESGVSGRGVFATKNIRKGKRFLVNPILLTKKEDAPSLSKTDLARYWFEWSKDTYAFAMGHGNFFNHSYKPNAEYCIYKKAKEIVFTAIKTIKKGEEIFVNYNGDPSCKDKIWFDK